MIKHGTVYCIIGHNRRLWALTHKGLDRKVTRFYRQHQHPEVDS